MASSGGRLRLLGALVAVSVLTRGLFLGVEILDLDEAAHAVGSWELLRGRLLYVDFADHKPPLLYVYYAVAQWLLGRGMLAVRLVTVLATVPLTAYALSAFFSHARVNSVDQLTFNGTRTDLAGALTRAQEELSGVPVSGLVVLSDGADNGGTPIARALVPIQAASVPVYTVGLGDEDITPDVQTVILPSLPRAVTLIGGGALPVAGQVSLPPYGCLEIAL